MEEPQQPPSPLHHPDGPPALLVIQSAAEDLLFKLHLPNSARNIPIVSPPSHRYSGSIMKKLAILFLSLALFSCAGGSPSHTTTPPPPPTDSWGLLSNGLRDKTQWPLDSASLWNTAIGSAATYQPANILANNSGGSPTVFVQDEDVLLMDPTAPLTDVYYNGAGWTGSDRCAVQGTKLTSLPIPANYTLLSNLNNNSTAVLLPDGHTIEQNQPLTRCTAGGPATTLVTFPDSDITGLGIAGAHGGSGLTALGGTIRLGEFKSGKIHHPMKVELWAAQYYYCCTYHWPATVIDDYANPTTYGGPNPNLGPGALLALSPSFNVSQLQTKPGKILAQAFIDYGAYVVDDTFWNAWALATEQGPQGRVTDEFQQLYSFSMSPAQGSPFMADMTTIFQSLQIVTNSTQSSIGGGGTPRVLAPPAIGN